MYVSTNPAYAPLASKHEKRIKSMWPLERVANLLYEQLPVGDRLPGSPTLRVEVEDNMVILRQSYDE